MKQIIPESEQENLAKELLQQGYDFFSGVPDSTLKKFISVIESSSIKHIRATWEGEAVGLAAGVFLAGKKPCVYLQNSGIGLILDALTSLCIPCAIDILLVIGHRTSPEHHRIMGEVDELILKKIGWSNYILVVKDE